MRLHPSERVRASPFKRVCITILARLHARVEALTMALTLSQPHASLRAQLASARCHRVVPESAAGEMCGSAERRERVSERFLPHRSRRSCNAISPHKLTLISNSQ